MWSFWQQLEKTYFKNNTQQKWKPQFLITIRYCCSRLSRIYQFNWHTKFDKSNFFSGVVLFELYSYGDTPYKKQKTEHVLGFVVSAWISLSICPKPGLPRFLSKSVVFLNNLLKKVYFQSHWHLSLDFIFFFLAFTFNFYHSIILWLTSECCACFIVGGVICYSSKWFLIDRWLKMVC